MIIYGKIGSEAEKYAKTDKFTFADVDTGKIIDVEDGVIRATSIQVNKTSVVLNKDKDITVIAVVNPADATDITITWTTSDESVATVKDGKITAVGAGTATVTATTANGLTATVRVTVKDPVVEVTEIILDKDELTLETGTTETLTATVTPDNATDKTVTWTTSDEKVATVDENGKVTAVSVGTATITATTTGKTATCTVTVTDPIITIASTQLSQTDYTYDGTAKEPTVTVKDANGNVVDAANYDVEFSNNNPIHFSFSCPMGISLTLKYY